VTPKDLLTIVVLALGLVWGTIMLILWKRRKTKPKTWPNLLGIGTGIYTFVAFMTFSIFLRPISEFPNYTITNILWSLALGGIGYTSGRKIARNMPE
jgi:hypothetical protein